MRFTERAAHFAGVTRHAWAAAPVELEGQAAYARGQPDLVRRAGAAAAASRCATRRGCAACSTPTCASSATTPRQWLTGTVDVRQAVWTRRYDVASELLAPRRARPRRRPRLGGGAALRRQGARARARCEIDNNLATLQARADLTLQGTYAAPVVLGRAEIDRGRVYFQGNTYVIRRGTHRLRQPAAASTRSSTSRPRRASAPTASPCKVNGTLERVYPDAHLRPAALARCRS